jgi:tRNA A-37 threonylcarbamoyl transferase component Bud32
MADEIISVYDSAFDKIEWKASRENSFITVKRNGMRLRIKNECKEDLLKLGIENPGRAIKNSKAKIIRNGLRSLVVSLAINHEGLHQRIALKYYKRPGLSRRLKDVFRSSKAAKDWIAGNRLLELGVKTPVPLAVGERRRFRFLQESFLVTEEVTGSKTLGSYLAVFAPPLSKEKLKEKRDFISRLAREVGRIHNQGFFHGSLSVANVLVRKTPQGNMSFYFLDLDYAKVQRRVSPYQKIKDLATLRKRIPSFITKTDKLRFFIVYCKETGLTNKDARRYTRLIEARILKRSRHKSKSLVLSRGNS